MRIAHITLTFIVLVSTTACTWMSQVDVSDAGEGLYGRSVDPVISGDGRFVALSSTKNMAGPDYISNQIYLRDMRLNKNYLVSTNESGQAANVLGGARTPSISADGRFISFGTAAGNLVENDTNDFEDIFVRDHQAGTTTRVSVDSSGGEANQRSYAATISDNGRYVAFLSHASNLTANDTNNVPDVFVHDRDSGTTSLVSVDENGLAFDSWGNYGRPEISADGRLVVFQTTAALVSDDTNGLTDIYVHDRNTGQTKRVSVTSSGAEVYSTNEHAAISPDGRYVVFTSWSSELVPSAPESYRQLFLHDLQTGETSFALNPPCQGGLRDDDQASLSADGRYIAFSSQCDTHVADDTNTQGDVFVHDRLNSTTTRVSVTMDGIEGNRHSTGPRISNDGRYVVFSTIATNLLPEATGYVSIIIKGHPAIALDAITPDLLPIGTTSAITISGSNFPPGTVLKVASTQVSNVVIVDENTMTADVSVPADAASGPVGVSVYLFGTGAGDGTGTLDACPDCVTLF